MLTKRLIENVITGFNLGRGKTLALNFWGDDQETYTRISQALEAKGHTLTTHQVSLEAIREAAEAGTLSHDEETLKGIQEATHAVDVFMHPPMLPPGFPKEKIGDFKRYLGDLFKAMSHEKARFIQWRLPSDMNAKAKGIEPALFKKAYLKAYRVDFKKLKERAETVHERLKNVKSIRIVTNGDTLEFSLGERPWHKDMGDGDIPCGEIAVAPVEDSANGTLHVGRTRIGEAIFEDLTLTFKNGQASSEDPTFAQALEPFTGDKKMIAEFGIGLNDAITTPIGESLHDEKILHTVHIAIGANTMFGGVNEADIHHDFVFTPDKIFADDAPIYVKNTLQII